MNMKQWVADVLASEKKKALPVFFSIYSENGDYRCRADQRQ